MTREPFIAHSELTNEIYIVQGQNKYRVTEQVIHAVKAIKALGQEPTTKNDLGVDNQNIRLIDANALIKRLRPKHFDWWGEGEQDDFSKGNNSMLEEVIEAIEELPSVTPQEPRWISVNERVPEDGTLNLFTDGMTVSVERYKADALDHFYPDGRWFSLDEVIAWMPLPKPYEPMESEG